MYTGDYVIDCNGLACKVGHKYLVKDVTWQVRPGEHWVVFGMNGCGKTTLLSMVSGFRSHSAGSVKVFGEELSDDNALDVRKRVGWVSSSFFDKYYSKEFVTDIVISGKYGTLGIDSAVEVADRKRANALLAELSLSHVAGHTFDMLSKGERQNVLIARALFSSPEVLVLDEPCTGLDVYNREYLFRTLEELCDSEGLTIIYVTHYVEEIKPMFDRCLLMNRGRVVAQGATRELFDNERISSVVGHPVHMRATEDGEMFLGIDEVRSNLVNLYETSCKEAM